MYIICVHCLHTYIYTYIYEYVFVYVCNSLACVHTYIYIHMYTCMHARTNVCMMCVCNRTCTCVHVNMPRASGVMYKCVSFCICIHVCIQQLYVNKYLYTCHMVPRTAHRLQKEAFVHYSFCLAWEGLPGRWVEAFRVQGSLFLGFVGAEEVCWLHVSGL